MRHAFALITTFVLTLGLLSGCDSGSVGKTASSTAESLRRAWLNIPSATTKFVELVHEGTGLLLDKKDVKIEKVSEVRHASGESQVFVADFKVTVSKGGTSIDTTITDVPLREDGILTTETTKKLKEAVANLKESLQEVLK